MYTYSQSSPNGGPKTTRDTPKVAAICFVHLTMLACDLPIKISLCTAFFCSFPPLHSLGRAYRTPTAIGAPTAIRDSPKVAAICFVHLMMLAHDPRKTIIKSTCIFFVRLPIESDYFSPEKVHIKYQNLSNNGLEEYKVNCLCHQRNLKNEC